MYAGIYKWSIYLKISFFKERVTSLFSKFLLLFLILSSFDLKKSLGRKVVWEEINWNVIETNHFDIHYPKGYDNLGKIASIYAEEANIFIAERMDHRLSHVVPIFIYNSHSHFQSTNIIPNTLDEGIGGFTEILRRRVVLPYTGSYDEFRHVLTHELVHAFQYDILYGQDGGSLSAFQGFGFPLWLIEGMAEYFSIEWDETGEMAMRDAILTNTTPSLKDLTELRVSSGYIIYKAGQSIMFFIDKEYGRFKIPELLKNLRAIGSIRNAIRSTFGISFDEFDQKWRTWFKRRYAKDTHKETDDEAALLISRHLQDGSFLNLHPAISDDGKKIAYLTIRNFLPAIVVKETAKYQKKKSYDIDDDHEVTLNEEVIVQGGNNNQFYQLNILDNRISFTRDSKKIFFAAKSGGKDHLYLYDIESRKVVQKWSPALDFIKYPRLSNSETKAIMVGVVLGQSDIYILDLNKNEIRQITFDLFAERDPFLSGDDQYALFSSNRNAKNNYESTHYHIFEINISNQKVTKLTKAQGKQLNPSYYYKDKTNRILYSSNQTGVYNAFLMDKDDSQAYQITNVQGGVFEPYTDRESKRIIFTMYRKQGYDISIKEAPKDPKDVIQKPVDAYPYKEPEYPHYGSGLSSFTSSSYSTRFFPEVFFLTLFYSQPSGLGGFGFFSINDYLGNHNLQLWIDYLSNGNRTNFGLSYGFLKKKIDFYTGIYRRTSHLSIFDLRDINRLNDYFYNPYSGVLSLNSYGVFIGVIYPFTPFWQASSRLDISRYEESFVGNDRFNRSDVFTNVQSISFSTTYNNVMYSFIGPLDGIRANYTIEQAFSIINLESVYTRQALNVGQYFLFFKRFIFAYSIFIRTVHGSKSNSFPYIIGGYYTIRGIDINSIAGRYTFIGKLELRFPIVDAILVGFPVPWLLRGFSGVFFFDMGSSFSNLRSYKFYEDRRLKDFKLTFGLGGRFLLVAGIYIRVDWATPWDFRTALPISKWRGLFTIGTEF